MSTIWKGHVRFSLVTIPVRIYNAIDSAQSISFNLLSRRGITHFPMGKKDKVMDRWFAVPADNFTLALRSDTRHYESHYNLANLYAEIGNYNPAKVHYTISIELEPTFPNSYFNLGLTLAVTKEFNETVEALRHFTRLSPTDDHKQVN